MPEPRQRFYLYGCAVCGWRNWITVEESEHVQRPGTHDCRRGEMPRMKVALVEELPDRTTEVDA